MHFADGCREEQDTSPLSTFSLSPLLILHSLQAKKPSWISEKAMKTSNTSGPVYQYAVSRFTLMIMK